MSGSAVRVVDDDGSPVADGVIGHVQLSRPGPATYRYLGRPRPASDDWHDLGDLGHLDADGYLFLADRADDRIVTGGIDVWPAAVESVLETHPAVRSCVVVGVPDADLGDRVRAVVDVGDTDVDEAALARWAAEHVDPEQRPREWVVVHEVLRDDTGKVRRSRWRAADGAADGRTPAGA